MALTNLLDLELVDVADDGGVYAVLLELAGHHASFALALQNALDQAIHSVGCLGCMQTTSR